MKAAALIVNKRWFKEFDVLLRQVKIDIKRTEVEGVSIYLVTPDKIDPIHEHGIFIYVHGGAFVVGNGKAGLQEAILIADRLKMIVISVDYKLAPDYKYPIALDEIITVYEYVRERNPKACVTLGGTSAGGGLVMVAIQKLIADGKRPPDIAYLGTPAADISETGVTLTTNRDVDEAIGKYGKYGMKIMKLYAGDIDLKDPRVSPIYGSFDGFPPTILVTGTKDLLLSSTARTHIALLKAGVTADILVYESQSHGDYARYYDTNNSWHMYSELNKFIIKHCRANIDNYFDAYVYAYPLVLMDATRRRLNIPYNTTMDLKVTPKFNLVVKPNLDTYYTSSFINVQNGPVMISIPKIDRFHMIPFLDAFTNVFAVFGTRNKGSGPYNIFITSEDWKGKVPGGYDWVKTPTSLVWMIARIRVESEQDGDINVVPLQKQIIVQSYNDNEEVLEQENFDETPFEYVRDLSISEFFNRFSELTEHNPIQDNDQIIASKMDRIGIISGQKWTPPCSLPEVNIIAREIEDVWQSENSNITSPIMDKGWIFETDQVGRFDTNYSLRAFIARFGLGANLPEDAVYPIANIDSSGRKLCGKFDYVVQFDSVPPVKAFWSLTLYDDDDAIFANPDEIYSLGSRDDLSMNTDGTFEIIVASEKTKENWIPSPPNKIFSLVLRLYWPTQEILNRKWPLPNIKRI